MRSTSCSFYRLTKVLSVPSIMVLQIAIIPNNNENVNIEHRSVKFFTVFKMNNKCCQPLKCHPWRDRECCEFVITHPNIFLFLF